MTWALAVTETVSYGVLTYAFAVLLVPMRTDLHTSTAALTGAYSVLLAAGGIAAPFTGMWLDRHGARGLMSTGSLAAAAGVVAWAHVHTVAELYAVFAVIGVASSSVLYEPAMATIRRSFDGEERGKALLRLTVVAGFASTIFMPATQGLVELLGWRGAVTSFAVLQAATAIPHAVLLPSAPRHGQLPDDHGSTRQAGADVRRTLTDAVVGWLTLGSVLGAAAVAVMSVHFVAYLRENGLPAGAAALAAGGFGIMSVTGRVVMTGLGRRYGVARVTAVILAGQGLSVMALLALPRPLDIAAFVVAFGAGFGVLTIARPVLLGVAVPAALYARVSGVQAAAITVGRIAAPALAGWGRTATGGYGVVLAGVAVAALLSAATLVPVDVAMRARRDGAVRARRRPETAARSGPP